MKESFPGFNMAIILDGLSPYGRDLILHEAYVEPCEQPLVSFMAKVL